MGGHCIVQQAWEVPLCVPGPVGSWTPLHVAGPACVAVMPHMPGPLPSHVRIPHPRAHEPICVHMGPVHDVNAHDQS
jgi:hypothetical protein